MASCACFLVPTNRIDAAVRDRLLDELVGAVDVGQRLLQVDDVDAVALGEDVALHLRVPAPGLVPEVHAGVEQLLHGDDGHGRIRTSSVSCAPGSARRRCSVVAAPGWRPPWRRCRRPNPLGVAPVGTAGRRSIRHGSDAGRSARALAREVDPVSSRERANSVRRRPSSSYSTGIARQRRRCPQRRRLSTDPAAARRSGVSPAGRVTVHGLMRGRPGRRSPAGCCGRHRRCAVLLRPRSPRARGLGTGARPGGSQVRLAVGRPHPVVRAFQAPARPLRARVTAASTWPRPPGSRCWPRAPGGGVRRPGGRARRGLGGPRRRPAHHLRAGDRAGRRRDQVVRGPGDRHGRRPVTRVARWRRACTGACAGARTTWTRCSLLARGRGPAASRGRPVTCRQTRSPRRAWRAAGARPWCAAGRPATRSPRAPCRSRPG